MNSTLVVLIFGLNTENDAPIDNNRDNSVALDRRASRDATHHLFPNP